MPIIKKMVEVEVEICDFCGNEITDGNRYDETKNGEIICYDCAMNDYFCCPECEEYFPIHQGIRHWMMGSDIYCSKCTTSFINELLELIKEVEEEKE